MLIIPAIDLKDGQCVRLRQGLMEDSTVFLMILWPWRLSGLLPVHEGYIWSI